MTFSVSGNREKKDKKRMKYKKSEKLPSYQLPSYHEIEVITSVTKYFRLGNWLGNCFLYSKLLKSYQVTKYFI